MPVQEPLMSNCGMAMPRILYGTAWKKERTAPLVEQAIGLGFRGIDTACQPKHYDEAGVGIGVATALGRDLSREDLYLQTKFTSLDGQDPARISHGASCGGSGRETVLARPFLQAPTKFRVGMGVISPDHAQ